jgi:molybdopterin-guanine dinucleotide biosynthesis protein B
MAVPVITIVGQSGSGKTRFMESLIAELKRRGYRIGTLKHHSHPGFEIDQAGKDSWRHARAGSHHVVVAAPDKIAAYRLLERELCLDEILPQFDDVDLVLVEGYREAGKPSIEIVRGAHREDLISPVERLLALITEKAFDLRVPQFKPGDLLPMADRIEARFLKR